MHLDELLCAVSRELEADLESVPKTVRCAAVDLAGHIVRRSSIPVPRWLAGNRAGEPGRHPDHPAGVPFSRSIRLGRMG
ncbi:hypothetical protein [Pseudonocardia lacus]|uniref:hypothetical protein n=1 Tax=Pseudonocardia lacus TaxID=2835865 RepID=UPI001BDD23DD|nr:hypothetical protein [Pseudonocardia lacus]